MADTAPLAIYDVMVAVRRRDGTRDVTIATVRHRTLLFCIYETKAIDCPIADRYTHTCSTTTRLSNLNGHSIPSCMARPQNGDRLLTNAGSGEPTVATEAASWRF